MKRNKRWLTASALALLLTAPVAAQDQAAEFESARAPGWTFVPGLAFGWVYDSNIAISTATADTGRTAADEVMLASPFAQLEYVARRTEFMVGYRGSARRYMDVEQLNTFSQGASLSFRRLATKRLTLFVQNAYADMPSTDDTELNGVPFSRTGARRNAFSGTMQARLTRYTDLSVRYDNTWVDFERKENFLTSGWVNGVRAELSRRLGEHTTLGGEYDVRLAELNEGTRELTFQDAGGTFRQALGQHTSFSAGAGLSRLHDRFSGFTHTGPYVRTAITHSAARATVGASFERTFVPSFGFAGSSESQAIRGFVHMPITRNRTYAQGSISWRRTDPFVTDGLRLDTLAIRTTIGHALARWFRTEAFYAHTRQDSEVTGGEVSRHRVGVQFVVSQPMRIR